MRLHPDVPQVFLVKRAKEEAAVLHHWRPTRCGWCQHPVEVPSILMMQGDALLCFECYETKGAPLHVPSELH